MFVSVQRWRIPDGNQEKVWDVIKNEIVPAARQTAGIVDFAYVPGNGPGDSNTIYTIFTFNSEADDEKWHKEFSGRFGRDISQLVPEQADRIVRAPVRISKSGTQ